MKPTTLATHYQHIDNGGITVSVEDRGTEEGVVLAIDCQYFGYPGIQSSLRLDPHVGGKWLEDVGKMLIKAADKFEAIDWKTRYEEAK